MGNNLVRDLRLFLNSHKINPMYMSIVQYMIVGYVGGMIGQPFMVALVMLAVDAVLFIYLYKMGMVRAVA